MLSYADAKNARSISVVIVRGRRLDESRATADPRLSARGESDSFTHNSVHGDCASMTNNGVDSR